MELFGHWLLYYLAPLLPLDDEKHKAVLMSVKPEETAQLTIAFAFATHILIFSF